MRQLPQVWCSRRVKRYLKFFLILSLLIIKKKYFLRTFSRLESYKHKFSRYVAYKFRYELFSIINKAFFEKRLFNKFSYDRNFWFYVFQLESIKTSQFNKLLLYNTKVIISDEVLSSIKNVIYDKSQKFFFSFFLHKFQLILKDILKNDIFFISSSVLPLDSVLNTLFCDIRKKLCFFYNSFFILDFKELKMKSKKDIFDHKLDLLADIYNVSFSLSDKFFLGSLFFLRDSSKNLGSSSKFEILLSVEFINNRLRSLGFIHKLKNRPVSNSKYIYLDDLEIIKIFGNFSFSFLFWFGCVKNISTIKYVVELLRQSCFLTLCRKHNKRKQWALNIYTSDLLITQNLFNSYSFFPKKSLVLGFKRKFFFYHSQVYFNETLFL